MSKIDYFLFAKLLYLNFYYNLYYQTLYKKLLTNYLQRNFCLKRTYKIQIIINKIFKLFIKNVVFFRQSINKIQINALYYIFRLIKIVSYFTFSLSTFGISQTFV